MVNPNSGWNSRYSALPIISCTMVTYHLYCLLAYLLVVHILFTSGIGFPHGITYNTAWCLKPHQTQSICCLWSRESFCTYPSLPLLNGDGSGMCDDANTSTGTPEFQVLTSALASTHDHQYNFHTYLWSTGSCYVAGFQIRAHFRLLWLDHHCSLWLYNAKLNTPSRYRLLRPPSSWLGRQQA